MQGILIIGIFLLLFLGYFHNITAITQDLGRHLLTGKLILTTHLVPKKNLFSYTYPDFPFINHHWFSEVIFYLWYSITGFNGLLLLTCCVLLLTFGLIFLYAVKRNTVFAILITVLFYFPILFERTDVRPEIFSFLFLSLFIVILYRFREKYTKWIFLLIPLELVWVNTHIYFPIGIAVLGLFLSEEVILFLFYKRKDKKLQTLLFVSVLCCLAVLFNPNGLKGALYPLQVFQNYGYSIEENQNVFFLEQLYPHESIQFFFITAGLLFTFLFAMKRKAKVVDWLLALFFTYVGTSAIRNLPLFVFGTFLIFSTNLSFVLEKILGRVYKRWKKEIIDGLLYAILLLAIVSQCFLTVLQQNTGFGLPSGAQPAADFFLKKHLQGPIFNNFDIGSYLEYRLYPKEKVFVDGRPEAYPKGFFQNVYIPMQQDAKKFAEVDKKYHFNTIFFSYTDQTPWAHSFLQFISHNPSWKIVYIDNYVIILVKNTQANKKLVSTSEKTFSLPNLEAKTQQELLAYAYLFNTIGWIKQEEQVYQLMLVKNSQNCDALYNLSILYFKENNPAKNIYAKKTEIFCPELIKR